jgi:hypothetical protein
MDSGEEIFLTQNFKDFSSGVDTDVVLNYIVDLQAETSTNQRDYPNFDLKLECFSDISDAEHFEETDRISTGSHASNAMKQLSLWMSDLERERMAKSRFSSKTDAKSKWAVNLLADWLNNRNEQYGDREDICQIKHC